MLEISEANQRVLLHRARAPVRPGSRRTSATLRTRELLRWPTSPARSSSSWSPTTSRARSTRTTRPAFEEHLALCPGCDTLPRPDAQTASRAGGDPGRDPLRGDAVRPCSPRSATSPADPAATLRSRPLPRSLDARRGVHQPAGRRRRSRCWRPLTLGLAPRLRFPAVVLEIVAGVVVGPQALGWVEVDLPVSIVALLGLAFLLFLAGLEIDVHRLRGRCCDWLWRGTASPSSWGSASEERSSVAGWAQSPGLVAVTLSATSLGLVVPVLKDAGQVESRLGQTSSPRRRSPTSPRSCCSPCCSRPRSPAPGAGWSCSASSRSSWR